MIVYSHFPFLATQIENKYFLQTGKDEFAELLVKHGASLELEGESLYEYANQTGNLKNV